MFGSIELTETERELWRQIKFEISSFGENPDDIKASLEHAYKLSMSLIHRRAIPEVRWRYFVDPDLNIGYKLSRMEIFEKNGTTGDDILRHPHFLKYLRYFVLGPDLPIKTISSFSQAVNDCKPVTSGDVTTLCDLARREVRTQGLERKYAAEEFFKLALELELGLFSRHVRDSVMTLRTK